MTALSSHSCAIATDREVKCIPSCAALYKSHTYASHDCPTTARSHKDPTICHKSLSVSDTTVALVIGLNHRTTLSSHDSWSPSHICRFERLTVESSSSTCMIVRPLNRGNGIGTASRYNEDESLVDWVRARRHSSR